MQIIYRVIFFITLIIACFSAHLCFAYEKKIFTKLFLQRTNNQHRLVKLWETFIHYDFFKCHTYLHPAWQNENIFLADSSGMIKKIDINNGKVVWKLNLFNSSDKIKYRVSPIMLSGGVVLSDDKIYIGSELAKIYAICANTGTIIWQTKVAGEVLSAPVISGHDTLLIYTSIGMLQALNVCDGSIRWTMSFDAPLFSLRSKPSPVSYLDMVVLGDDIGIVSVVLLNEGKLLWQRRISSVNEATKSFYLNSITTTPILIDDVVYVHAYNFGLTALDIYSGQIIWLLTEDIVFFVKNMIAVDYVLYLINQDDQVIAVDARDGLVLWKQDSLLNQKFTVPVIYNDYIVIGDEKGYINLISTKDGSIFLREKICTSKILKTIIIGNKFIVQSRNGKIYAFVL